MKSIPLKQLKESPQHTIRETLPYEGSVYNPEQRLDSVLSQPSQGGRDLTYLAKLQNHSVLYSSSGGVTYKKSDQANNDLLFD